MREADVIPSFAPAADLLQQARPATGLNTTLELGF